MSSNLALGLVDKYADHPFPDYFRGEICESGLGHRPLVLSTDDAGIFATDLSREFMIAATTFKLTWAEVRLLAEASLINAFVAPTVKAKLRKRLSDQLAVFQATWKFP